MSAKQVVTRNGDVFTTISEESFTDAGFKIDRKVRTVPLDHLLRTARRYKRTLDDIEAAATFMESALTGFYQSETVVTYMDSKGMAAIFGMIQSSILAAIELDYDSGIVIDNFD